MVVDLSSKLFNSLDSPTQLVLLTHGDSVTQVGTGFKVIAWSGGVVAGIECTEKNLYGLQFHPEVCNACPPM